MNGPAIHGGDVHGIARACGRCVDEFLDFSANINPLGPPSGVRTLLSRYAASASITRYPEPGLPELTAVLARARSVDPQNILVHGGSAALFDVILRACAPRALGICLPAFAEYARAAAANHIDVRTVPLDPHAAPAFDVDRVGAFAQRSGVDALVLTNPHNPLGFALTAAQVRELRSRLPVTLIVDEAFADYDESGSVARDAAADPGLIVVRSLTKFYAMPDLRVGYAVMTAENVARAAGYVPAWPVSGVAAAAAAAAVGDEGYACTARTANARGRAQLHTGLTALGFRALPAAANFITFEVPSAAELRERLLRRHLIVVRDCTSFEGLAADRYIRVAVRSPADNARLLAALAAPPAVGNPSHEAGVSC